MSKPSWDDAPSWANYLAQNEDGQWFWYEKKPEISVNMGYFYATYPDKHEEASFSDDWECSLEKR